MTRGKIALGFAVITCFTLIAAYNVLHGSSVLWTGLGLASIWYVVADWLGGRQQMYRLAPSQIYQRFRAGLAPLPPLARGIKNAALLLAVAVVAYYLSRS